MAEGVFEELQRGASSFRRGDFAAALSICEAVLRRAPQDPEAQHLRAMALGRLGRIDEAAAAYGLAAKSHPNKAAVYANLANALAAAGRAAEAVGAYRRALEHNGSFAPAWAGLGIALAKTGDDAGAENAFREAIRLNPAEAGSLNNLGLLCNRSDRQAEALALFEAAVKVNAGFVAARVNRGNLLRDLGRIEEACAEHRTAIAAAPASPEANYQLANSLRAAGRLDEATAQYRRALAIDPGNIELHRDLARLLWEQGARDSFLSELDAAIARDASEPLLLLRSELSFLAADVGGAEASAQRVLNANPKSARALWMVAKAKRASGRAADALDLARRAHAADAADFEIRHELCERLLASGAFAEAADLVAGDAPRDHLQKQIALRALALRAKGDESYRRLYDYDRLTAKLFIHVPKGYSSIDEFNRALEAALRPLHSTAIQPIDQTLYGGTQSFGRLWKNPHPVIQALKDALLETARRYVEGLPDDPGHPFLAQKSLDLTCAGAWSVMLSSGGGHVDHIHPAGWISATYYVRVPPEVAAAERQGFLRLGGSGITGLSLPAERYVRPEEGAAVFFPSYIWHGVEAFEAPTPRITAPFDLAHR